MLLDRGQGYHEWRAAEKAAQDAEWERYYAREKKLKELLCRSRTPPPRREKVLESRGHREHEGAGTPDKTRGLARRSGPPEMDPLEAELLALMD